MENSNEKKEVDLFDILSMLSRKCAGMIMAVGHALAWILRFAYRKRSFVVVAVVAALVFTAYWSRPTNRRYQMEAEIRINVIDAFYFHDQVASLNRFCVNNDRVAMSSLLGLKPQVCNRILSANSFFYIDKLRDGTPDEVCYGRYVADTTKRQMEDRLLIRLVVSDTTNMALLQKGLQYYFDHNPIVVKMNAERLSQLDGRISSIGKEVQLLDSLRRIQYFKKTDPDMKLDGSLFLTEKDKQLYHGDILSLEKDMNSNQYERVVNANSVNFASEFVLIKVLNTFQRTLALSLPISLLAFFFLALLLDKRGAIKDFLERK
jgi:hypothetical protein